MTGPGKGADAGAFNEARDALAEDRPVRWFIERALASKPARRGVAAAIGGPGGELILAALVDLVGEDASPEKLLRRAAGRDVAAQVRRNPIARNEGFDCSHCGATVPSAPGSSVRNHCPHCLCSLHVDGDVPGDRAADCGGVMRPVRAEQRDGGWRVEQACQRCAHRRWNRLHPEWSVDPDRLDSLPS